MTALEVNILGTYNAEVARGVVHTKVWKERMGKLQEEFDNLSIRKAGQFCHDADKYKAW